MDNRCPISWKHLYDWDIPIDVYMQIVTNIGCDLFVPKEKHNYCKDLKVDKTTWKSETNFNGTVK
jgi:hypothetical protein